MPVETTVQPVEFSLAAPLAPNGTPVDWIRQGLIMAKLAMTGLLLWYMASWVHDFQRIQSLVAEPTPPFKVITKNEAWQRIYSRAIRSATAYSRLEGIAALK